MAVRGVMGEPVSVPPSPVSLFARKFAGILAILAAGTGNSVGPSRSKALLCPFRIESVCRV